MYTLAVITNLEYKWKTELRSSERSRHMHSEEWTGLVTKQTTTKRKLEAVGVLTASRRMQDWLIDGCLTARQHKIGQFAPIDNEE